MISLVAAVASITIPHSTSVRSLQKCLQRQISWLASLFYTTVVMWLKTPELNGYVMTYIVYLWYHPATIQCNSTGPCFIPYNAVVHILLIVENTRQSTNELLKSCNKKADKSLVELGVHIAHTSLYYCTARK